LGSSLPPFNWAAPWASSIKQMQSDYGIAVTALAMVAFVWYLPQGPIFALLFASLLKSVPRPLVRDPAAAPQWANPGV